MLQAELYAIKKLDRESLTNDTNDALLKVKIIAKPTDGGTSPPVEKSFNITYSLSITSADTAIIKVETQNFYYKHEFFQ